MKLNIVKKNIFYNTVNYLVIFSLCNFMNAQYDFISFIKCIQLHVNFTI